ncbi:hypothetical protein HY489_01855 [Candidatus Woesearchaeota archaeon]|nr:hypothetical protein [Candidatus Woesearchaeota archaeon]
MAVDTSIDWSKVRSLDHIDKQVVASSDAIKAKEALSKKDLEALNSDLDAIEGLTVEIESVSSDVLREEKELKNLVGTLQKAVLDAHRANQLAVVLEESVQEIGNSNLPEAEKHEMMQRLAATIEAQGVVTELSDDASVALAELHKFMNESRSGKASVTAKLEQVDLKALDLLRAVQGHKLTLEKHFGV